MFFARWGNFADIFFFSLISINQEIQIFRMLKSSCVKLLPFFFFSLAELVELVRKRNEHCLLIAECYMWLLRNQLVRLFVQFLNFGTWKNLFQMFILFWKLIFEILEVAKCPLFELSDMKIRCLPLLILFCSKYSLKATLYYNGLSMVVCSMMWKCQKFVHVFYVI